MPLAALASAALMAATAVAPSGDGRGERAVQLEWTAEPDCPPASELRQDLAHLSGGTLRVTESADVRVIATARADGPGFVLRLTVDDGERREHRVLHDPSCRTLARAAVLLTAVTLDSALDSALAVASRPGGAAAGPTIPRAPSIAPAAPRATRPAEVRPRAPSPSETPTAAAGPRHRAQLTAFGGPALAVVPAPTAVVGGSLGWIRGVFGLHITAWHAFAAERELEPGVGIRASVSGGGVHARLALRSGRLAIPLTLGIEAGALQGRGVGSRVRAAPTRSPWLSGIVGMGLVWPAHSTFALWVAADAVIAALRPGIHLRQNNEAQEVFRSPPVGARLVLGPVLRFP